MPNKSTNTVNKINAHPYKTSNDSSAQPGKTIGDGDAHYKIVADAAFYRALRRGFDAGVLLEDWLIAEEEVACMLYGNKKPDN